MEISYEEKHWDTDNPINRMDEFNHPKERKDFNWERYWTKRGVFPFMTLITTHCIYCQIVNIRRILWEMNKNDRASNNKM